MKSRALFLKNRSQKMLKERLSKYRLVSPRLNTSALDDPMTSDTTIRTLAITRKTSSVARRLADLNRSQNKAVTSELLLLRACVFLLTSLIVIKL
ncbi:unnamed protein product [Anisakis simplex]|uniref:Uncharacterized protein n=1 Tax=Anisakis simplex TaxID=6269 RepID=A0A0M3JCP0_ANISI|nr:unnamed protein product [Anisakis simplex]